MITDLVQRGSDDCPEGAEDDPDGRRDIHEANIVDVIVNSIEDGWNEKLE